MINGLLVAVLSVVSGLCVATWTQEYKTGVMFNNFLSTGDIDPEGLQYKSAILLAISEINNKTDGIYDDILPNITFSVISAQPANTKTAGAVSALYAVDEGVRAVIGPQENAPIEGGAKLLMENGIIQIGYHADEDDFTNRVYNNFVRTNPPSAQEGYVAPFLTYEKFKWTRVAVVKAYTSFGFHSSFKYDIFFTDYLGIEQSEIERTDHIIYPIQTDYTDIIVEIAATNFNIIAVYASASHGSAFLKAAYDYGLLKPGTQLIVSGFLTDPVVWKTHLSAHFDSTQIAELLHGAIAFRSIVNRSTPEALDFIHRFRSQPSTDGDQSDCNNATDSVGNYLHQNNEGTVCAGLDHASFDSTGVDLYDDTFFAYDAVISLAHALHHYIHVDKYDINYPFHYYLLMQSMNYISFNGASGRVEFEPFPDRQNNDRLSDMLYEVVNFQADIFLSSNNVNLTEGFVVVGYINTDSGYRDCNSNDEECYTYKFNTPTNDPPRDRPRRKTLRMSTPLVVVLRSAAVIVAIICVSFAAVLIYYRNRRIVRILQPELGSIIFPGGAALVAFGITLSLPVNDDSCLAAYVLGHLGFAMMLTPLIAKTWRINLVLNSGFQRVKVTALHTLLVALLLLFPIVITLLVDAALGSVSFTTQVITHTLTRHTQEKQCVFGDEANLLFLYSYESFLVLLGICLCYPIRDMPQGVSDAYRVARANIIIIVIIAVVLLILKLGGAYPSTERFIIAMAMLSGAISVIMCLYHDAIFKSLQGLDLNKRFEIVDSHKPVFVRKSIVLFFTRSGTKSVAPDESDHVRVSTTDIEHDEKWKIQLEIERLNQRLAHIANKQLYRESMSEALAPSNHTQIKSSLRPNLEEVPSESKNDKQMNSQFSLDSVPEQCEA
mmetsp:Transcript_6932/g.10400  ORF Transcript_6932/g.10400 Transcript_6932/m.10400 type:complete len:889 (-) Transcript_6932:122-2788(-)|eukprot:CAMPEP_0185031904 /NCGR_PEP_ID=MMETSP1103-20130426/19615_1 /TAXON_ID=36769 /ORGANISM="Paraphysomonas bandaiensis, Strain Caron Lab Isolate" /LENGTH=888 /DNA_ID=CAMNT_0027567585 /DNA_START=74 /DNA_END=2740 /DNA_ORIENTATION=-